MSLPVQVSITTAAPAALLDLDRDSFDRPSLALCKPLRFFDRRQLVAGVRGTRGCALENFYAALG